MNIKLENLDLNIIFIYQNKEISFNELFKAKKQSFKYKLFINKDSYKGNGITGRDSIFLPYSKKKGLKITRGNSVVKLENLIQIINQIKSFNIDIFSEIYSSEIIKINNTDNILITFVENVSKQNSLANLLQKYRSIKFVPLWDIPYLIKNLNIFSFFLDKFYYYMEKFYFFPEDEWYKKSNLINNKIIDFSRFTIHERRYRFPSNGYTKSDLLEEYAKLVNIFSDKRNSQYIPQWKGTLYEGFKFDNGYIMQGYKSDHYRFDSYKKLPFIPFEKVKNKDVLDIGSNHGFFSLQASLHGAREVIGVELDKNNIKVANRLKEIMNLKNVHFINEDITKYIFDSDKKFELIIMSSVLHQIYNSFNNSDLFLKELSNKCNYFAFETPVNHHTMKLKLSSIHKKLQKYFSVVRIQNVYDAYSSGYRANFICYN